MNGLSLAGRRVMSAIDKVNDRFTSYRLMLYFLISLVIWGAAGGLAGELPYKWYTILISAGFLLALCKAANELIARFLDIPANKESPYITGLILSLILTPASGSRQFAVAAAAGIAAISSKFLLTRYRSHIFNPAAAGAFIAGEVFHKYPSWWVGTKFMTPIVAIGAILILRKMKRFTMSGVFLAFYILYLIYGSSRGGSVHFLWLELISTPVLFFTVVMLTEPLTSPRQSGRYLPYTLIVALFYSVTRLRVSPEAALLIGNLFTAVFAANRRFGFKFVRRIKEAEGIYSYIFTLPKDFKFAAGQYMEWTLDQNESDRRGNRRYFTIASSPTEPVVIFTLKEPDKPSAFKRQLRGFKPGDIILGSGLAGEFTLPKDQSRKLAFLAGGVGITPFRSMAKQLADSGQKRDAVLVYAAAGQTEYAFNDIFTAARSAGLRTEYITGQLDQNVLIKLIPDYKQRTFYISGPYGFVHSMEESLLKAGLPAGKLVTDYFPGYGS